MKRYYITTPATEDRPEMTCEYDFSQWLEVKNSLIESGVKFNAYTTNF